MNDGLRGSEMPEEMATQLHTYQMSPHDKDKELFELLPFTT